MDALKFIKILEANGIKYDVEADYPDLFSPYPLAGPNYKIKFKDEDSERVDRLLTTLKLMGEDT